MVLKSGLVVFAVVIAFAVTFTLYKAGSFTTITPHSDYACTKVDGVVGAEDITIDHTSGMAYISATDRRNNRADINGIYRYMPGSLNKPLKLKQVAIKDFAPHGIDVWQNNTNHQDSLRLFVVNHPLETNNSRASQIDVFDIKGIELVHVASVKPDLPISLNDVTAASNNRFYASIDQGSATSLGRKIEAYLRLPLAGVMHGNLDGMEQVLDGMVYANGVQITADGKTLYVSQTTGNKLSAYAVFDDGKTLELIAESKIASGLDNIEFDNTGALWIASHPKLFAFLAHQGDAKKRSPSQIYKINHEQKAQIAKPFTVKEVYLNNGDPISGASVAAPYVDGVLIGSVFEPFILDCKFQSDEQ